MSASFDRAVVLNVDDNEAGRYAKTRILTLAGFHVLEAATGEEALKLAAKHHPELMLIDVRLPDINGRHVSLRIKSDPTTADIAVLQCSATHTDARHRVMALEAGADAYLVEPVEPEELVANVRALLRMRRAETQLRVTETRFRQMAESIGDVFWILDPAEMRFQYVSPAFETIWGCSMTEVIKDFAVWINAIHPEDRERAAAGYRGLADKGKYDEEYRIDCNGQVRWIANRGFPMQDGSGKRLVAGVAQDVTDRHAAEEAMRDLDRRKDEFLAMLAHELRNPLGPIRNAVEILRAAGKPELHGVAREMIGRQVTHLARLVDDLLDVSRITQGKVALQRSPVKLSAVLESALEMARPSLDATGHPVNVVLPEEPLWMNADPVRLTQVIGNLLNNAAKFTPPSGQVTVQAERRGEMVAISVKDTGIGIPSDVLPHVFDLFAQGDRSLDRTRGGLGIGLSLVKRLVEMHDGRVSAESAGPGQGSTFEIVLPLMPAPRDAPATLPPARKAQAVMRRVLVVDDSRDSAEALSIVLQQAGHDVSTAYGAHEALAMAKSFAPEVVFLDIGLPEMDGYELARRLRDIPETARSRLLALTGYGQQGDRERALSSGFDDHLVKPFDPEQLERVIG